MSIDSARQFVDDLQVGRLAVSEQRIEAIPNPNGPNAMPELLKIAEESGYSFTADECRTAVRECLVAKNAQSELNVQQLAGVVGGSRTLGSVVRPPSMGLIVASS